MQNNRKTRRAKLFENVFTNDKQTALLGTVILCKIP